MKMKIVASEYLSLILSLNHLSLYLNAILEQSIIRTIIVYYDNQTSLLASAVIGEIVEKHTTAYLAFNLDQKLMVSGTDDTIGGELVNICIYNNIADGKYLQLANVYFDARYTNVFMSTQSATDAEITDFFETIWTNCVLNAVLIFWWQQITIYTFFPYQRVFRVKILEWNGTGEPEALPKGLAAAILRPKNFYLSNRTFEVYTGSDPPKVNRVPGRFRIGPDYHFGGRDGFTAMIVERTLKGHFHYRTVARLFGLVDFFYNVSGQVDDPLDRWGRPMSMVVGLMDNPKLTFYNVSSHSETS